MEDPDDKMIWDALLRQAEANLRQAEANEGTSSTIKLLTQRMLCKENAAALEPDRLEAWYAANGDAEAITSLAGQIALQADSSWQGTIGGREVQLNNPPVFDNQVDKHVVGTKRRVPSVLDLLVKEPPSGAGTDVAKSLEADTTEVVHEDGLTRAGALVGNKDVQGHEEIGRLDEVNVSGVDCGVGARGSPPTIAIGAPAVQTDSGPTDAPMKKFAAIMSGVGCGVGARGSPPITGIGAPAVLRDPGPTDIPIAQLPRPPDKAPRVAGKSPRGRATGDNSDEDVVAPNVVGMASDALPCAQMGHALDDIGRATLPRPPESDGNGGSLTASEVAICDTLLTLNPASLMLIQSFRRNPRDFGYHS